VVLDAGRVVHTGRADELLADTDRTRALLGVGTTPVRGNERSSTPIHSRAPEAPS